MSRKPMTLGVVRLSNKWKGEHAKSCRCPRCLRNLLANFQKRVEAMGGLTPPDLEHSVPVRPHWRKQPNYLENDPLLHDIIFKEIEAAVPEYKPNVKRHKAG